MLHAPDSELKCALLQGLAFCRAYFGRESAVSSKPNSAAFPLLYHSLLSQVVASLGKQHTYSIIVGSNSSPAPLLLVELRLEGILLTPICG